jgi:hypothetical protein
MNTANKNPAGEGVDEEWPVAVGRWPRAGSQYPMARPMGYDYGFHEASMVGVVLQVLGR